MKIKKGKNKLVICLSIAVIAGSTLFSGCKGKLFGPEWSLFGKDRINTAGANQFFDKSFETIDLAKLLDPKEYAIKEFNNLKPKDKLASADYKKWNKLSEEDRVAKAIEAFHSGYNDDKDNNSLALRRNLAQDRIIAASNNRCNIYKTYLQQAHSRGNFLMGALTTTLAGAGGIVTGGAVNALSAGAAITSGIRAEYNQAYYAGLNTSIISKGIDQRRKELFDDMKKKRYKGGDREKGLIEYEKYNITEAVSDAIKYHGACNLIEGLKTADAAISDIGLKRLNESLGLMKTSLESFGDIKKLQEKMAGTTTASTPPATATAGNGI